MCGKRVGWAYSLALVLWTVSAACARDIYVPSDYLKIQDAINAAMAGDHIWVAQGTYAENLDFKGKAITLTGYVHPLLGRKTIIAPTALGPCVTFRSGEGSGSILEKLRLTGGRYAVGGGVSCRNNSSPTIRDCAIYGNSSTNGGGGVGAEDGSSPALLNNFINQNTCSNAGGGGVYYGEAVAPTIQGNTISENSCPTGGGGGLEVDCTGSALIEGNTLEGNTCRVGGGGLLVWDGTPIVRNNVVRNNTAAAGAGARMSYCAGMIFSSNTITGNVASGDGGGVILDHATGVFAHNIIAHNQAGSDGGGVACAYAPSAPNIAGNVLYGNTAQADGGGIYVDQGPAALAHNTLSGNGAANGGNLALYRAGPVTITNCLLTFATAGGGVHATTEYTVVTQTYCDVFGNVGGDYPSAGLPDQTGANGNIAVDPRYANPAAGDFHVRSCNGRWNPVSSSWVFDNITSPAVDAGDPASDFASETAPNGGRANLGAYGNNTRASRSSWLSSRRPAYGGAAVPRVQPVFLRFRKQVVQGSVETRFTVVPDSGTAVTGAFRWLQPFLEAEWWPDTALAPNTHYTVQIAPGVRGRDGATSTWAEQWGFTTGEQPGITAHGPTGTTVAPSTDIRVTFDTPMHRLSCQNNFRLLPSVAGSFSWVGNQMRFVPNSPLATGSTYTVQVLRKARSSAGVELGWTYDWAFTVRAPSSPPQLTVAAAGTTQGAQVTVNLTAAANVQTTILNLAGRTVATLPEQSCDAGTTTLLWNGRAAQGTAVPSGTYLLRITARTADGAQASALASCSLRR